VKLRFGTWCGCLVLMPYKPLEVAVSLFLSLSRFYEVSARTGLAMELVVALYEGFG
jgi:hypothetical protein